MTERGKVTPDDVRPRTDLVLLLVVTVLTQAALFMSRPMTSYRVLEIGGTAAQVGVVTACFSLLPLAVAMPVGRWVDDGRGVLLLRLGIGTAVIAAVMLAAAQSLWQIAAANIALGTGYLLNAVAAQGLLSRSAGLEGQDRLFGAFTVAASAGQLMGPPLASLVADRRGVDEGGAAAAILAASALSLVALGAVAFLRKRAPAAPRRARPSDGSRSSQRLLNQPGMAPAIVASLSVLACVDLLTSFLPVLAVERGIGVTTVGWLLALRAAASMTARIFVHRALRFLRRRSLLAVSMGMAGLLLVVLPWFTDLWVIAAVLLVAGFFLGIGQPLTMTWVVLLAGEDARATALALRLAGNRLGQVSVPGLAAVVAGASGAIGVFWLMGGVLTLALVPILRTANPD